MLSWLAGKKVIHHHRNRCSAACRTRRLNIVTVVPSTSAGRPYLFFFSLCFLPVIWKSMALSLYWCFKGQRGVKASQLWTMWLWYAISYSVGELRPSERQPSPGEAPDFRKQTCSFKTVRNKVQIREVSEKTNNCSGFFWKNVLLRLVLVSVLRRCAGSLLEKRLAF